MAPKIDPKTISDLVENVEELTKRLDNFTNPDDSVVDSGNSVLKKLTEAVNKLSDTVEELNKKTTANHTSLTNDIASIRNTVIKNLKESHTKLTVKVESMETKIIALETQLGSVAQRSRENNIEFQGIDNLIEDTVLEGTVIKLMSAMEIECFPWDIQGCHRLPARKGSLTKPVIVKFISRKKPELIVSNRSKLNCNLSHIDGLGSSSIYVNLNLSPYFKRLDYFCRRLKKEGKVDFCSISHTNATIKFSEKYHKICHIQDLKELFPTDDFTSRY